MNAFPRDGAIASVRRVGLIARQHLAEALRLRLTWLLAFAGLSLLAAARSLQAFNFGSAELKFIEDFGLGALGLVGTVLAAVATAHLFFAEIDRGSIHFLLTRPVRRAEYIAGHLAGMAVLLALYVVALGGLLAGLLLWRATQLGVPVPAWSELGGACGLQWLKFTLVAAMTLLVCSYAANSLFASGAGILLAVTAHLRELGGADGGSFLLRVWPNLALFDGGPTTVSGHFAGVVWVLGIGGYWAAYMILFGGLAAYVFKHREF